MVQRSLKSEFAEFYTLIKQFFFHKVILFIFIDNCISSFVTSFVYMGYLTDFSELQFSKLT